MNFGNEPVDVEWRVEHFYVDRCAISTEAA